MEINIHQPPEPDSPTMSDVTLEAFRVRSLYEGVPLSMAGNLALVIILSVSHWNIVGHGALIFWNLIIAAAIILRTTAWYFWRQNRYMLTVNTWLTIFRMGAWATGAAWGSAAFLMFANYNPSYQALLAYTIAGVSSGSFSTLNFDKDSALGFVGLSILPLTFRLFIENGPIAAPMGIMSIIYLLFVISAAARARRNLEDQYEKNSRLLDWSKEREQQQKLNKSISQAKTFFIKDANINNTFASLLHDTLELTDSKFGFIAEIIQDKNKKIDIELHALINLTDSQLLTDFYKKNSESDTSITAKNIPFSAAILHGKPIISNDPAKDIRGGGLPDTHPEISAFLSVPIFVGTTQVAILCLANKSNGYDENLMEFIKPVTATVTQFFEAIMHSRQQKNYEQKLRNNAKHTQAILDEVFDAIITIDKQGIIKSFNHAAEMIFGHRAEEIINSHINCLIPAPKHSEPDDIKHSHIMIEGQEQIGIRRNGKEFPVNLATSTILIEGEPLIISVVRDISQNKRNEELKSQFISTLSHELRTPLTSIAGALGILNNNATGTNTNPEQQQKLIDIAYQNSMQLQVLVNDLLDMDKLIANKMEMNIKSHCIVEIVHKAIEDNQANAEKYRVKLQLNNPLQKILIYGDIHRIHQVLSHLLSNSAKFSHPDSTVDISIAPAGKFAKITVTDYGQGVPEELKEKIFQHVTPTDGTILDQADGNGLGLAISKELIQKMGGNIGFTSNKNAGCSFYIELPLADNNIYN